MQLTFSLSRFFRTSFILSPLDDVLPDGPSVPSHEDDAAFKEKLKHMGKTSRKKFAHFAKIFSRRRRTSFPQLLGRNSHETAGRENLFGDDSYSQLENEGSDNESAHRKRGFSWSFVETMLLNHSFWSQVAPKNRRILDKMGTSEAAISKYSSVLWS